nr:hypothetical protein [Acidobacteriota bacterium]
GIAGALVAGAAIGLRLQTAALTLPLLAWYLVTNRATLRVRANAAGAWVAGVLVWAVPMLIDTGIATYFRALTAQAREDFTGVEMLATQPGARLFVSALYETFIDPFGEPLLAAAVLTCAVAGILLTLRHERGVLKAMAVAYGPYLIFHLLFQETVTNRYALPLLVPIAMFFVVPFHYLSQRAVLPAAAGAATAGLIVAVPALHAYRQTESPGLGIIRALHRLPRTGETVLAMHQRIADDLRRHQSWEAMPLMRTLPSTRDYEWLELVKLWHEGHDGPIWFLADPRRTDLRMIDPQQRKLLRSYGWPDSDLPFMGGTRPNRIDWYFIQRPGWFLGSGWALSPEIGGLTARDRTNPGHQPAVAWVRRRPGAMTLMLGGRHLGQEGEPPVIVRVRVDGRQVDEWPIQPGPFLFMRPILPEEMADIGTYSKLEIEASWPGGGDAPISLEQFDLQSNDGALVAYDQGWWEPEHDPRTGETWRWTSGEANLWLFNPGRDVTLVIKGEDPSRYYKGGTQMTVSVGAREVSRFDLHGDFSKSVVIPVEPLSVARGRVTIRLSNVHVPSLIRRSADTRKLGVRIYDVSVY